MKALATLLLVPTLAGCSAAFGAFAKQVDDGVVDGGPSEGGTVVPSSDAGSDGLALRGNPLCHADPNGCFPDDDVPKVCGSVQDAGADSGVYAAYACRVDPMVGAACSVLGPQAPAAEGASCGASSDCAPGFECVGAPARCRHYCCDESTCATYGKAHQKAYFCDVQPLATTSVETVPVCQPVTPCDLRAQDCGSGQTCAVVESDGTLTTSCVTVGPGKVGDSCAAQHCGANLQCIGAPMPTCHQLCDPQTPQCPQGTTCFHQWPVLDQQGVGVCKEP